MRRLLALFILAASWLPASDVTDLHPPWDAIKLVSFNRGDATDRSWLAQTSSNVGTGLSYSQRTATCTASNYITFPDNDSLDVTGDFAAMCWMKLGTPSTTYTFPLYKATGASSRNIALIIYWSGAAASVYCQYYNGSYVTANDPSTTPLSTWVHFAQVRSGGALRLYRDGAQVASTVSAILPVANTGSMTVGAFAGYIDDVRIYNTAKSAEEIAAIYAEGIGASRP